MKPTISVIRTSNSKNLQSHLKQLSEKSVYVGIPSTTVTARKRQLLTLAKASKGTKLVSAAAATTLNNAEVLYLLSKGSLIHRQPPRPVIEPAIVAPGNKESIAHELAQATKATLDGKPAEATRFLNRAGIAGVEASKKWFTDPRNGWPPNSPVTISRKGSDRPGIDTGALRQALTYVIEEKKI